MTADSRSVLRLIPAVETVLRDPGLTPLAGRVSGPRLTELVRLSLARVRQDVLEGRVAEVSLESVVARIVKTGLELTEARLRRVINASGVILHTNLGRAPLSARALEAVRQAAADYSNVEYDLERGERGSRMSHVEGLLTFLTGAEAALAVNNNAAAVLLALNSLAQGRDVLVSRGELVEIGGSFRIPDVMERSGARLREIGTTNKTHPRDYEKSITAETALLLKVHASNYRIEGFTADVGLPALSRIGERHGVPVMVDLGSGALVDVSGRGISREPLVAECLAAGADLVTFSGDKLLGGPQAGIIVGRRDLVQKLKQNPLARAVRLDKLTLAALTATLVDYLDPEAAWDRIPTLRMIGADPAVLAERARELAAALAARLPAMRVDVQEAETAVGGGALPLEGLRSWVVTVTPADGAGVTTAGLERALRAGDPAVVARVQTDRLMFDLRTLTPEDAGVLPDVMAAAFARAGSAPQRARGKE